MRQGFVDQDLEVRLISIPSERLQTDGGNRALKKETFLPCAITSDIEISFMLSNNYKNINLVDVMPSMNKLLILVSGQSRGYTGNRVAFACLWLTVSNHQKTLLLNQRHDCPLWLGVQQAYIELLYPP
ncbi:hypothetical protein RRG08_029249 [Elysia crispata]|uniref:Uncharacterized protein n=1 Tax=Elysia crispata TaxID=231223 RepID=A0AAE1ALC4_9GAST|nr:hypothetical protein RRG08_029249 [Elysia crispata]